ncbi:unnamed protein product, partial [Prorocentrum cordatum]
RPAAQHGRAAVAALHGALLRRQARRGPAQSLSQRLHVQLRERGHLRAPSAALRPIDRGDLVVLYGLRHAVRRQEGDHDDHQHERRGCSCPRWSRAVAGPGVLVPRTLLESTHLLAWEGIKAVLEKEQAHIFDLMPVPQD